MSRAKKLPILASLSVCALAGGVLATSGVAYGSIQPRLKHSTVVESEDFIIPIGGQSDGSVTCPTGTVPLGGGGDMTPSDGLSLSTSRPNGSDWDVTANNNTSALQFFRVFAVCAQAPKNYSVAVHAVSNPAGTVASTLASCPAGTVVFGGGFSNFSSSPAVSANSSFPTAFVKGQPNGWQVLVANASTSSNLAADAVAVCGKKPNGYKIATSPSVILQAHSDARATATCPGTLSPSGGGVEMAANPPALLEVMNSTLPLTGQWQSFENNDGPLADSMVAVTVCIRLT